MKLQNRNLILTGASGGIGTAIAETLAMANNRLVLVGRDIHRLGLMAKFLPGHHRVVQADLTRAADIGLLFDEISGVELDGLIHCAGHLQFGLFEEQSPEVIEHTLETNLVAPMKLCRGIIPHLAQRPEAIIALVGSTFGQIGHPGFSTYCASKFGLRGFAEALRRELAAGPIRVTCLSPRTTATSLNSSRVDALNQALGNSVDFTNDVARELVSLVESGDVERQIGWPEKFMVRINALFPTLVDRAIGKKLPIVQRFASTNPSPGETP